MILVCINEQLLYSEKSLSWPQSTLDQAILVSTLDKPLLNWVISMVSAQIPLSCSLESTCSCSGKSLISTLALFSCRLAESVGVVPSPLGPWLSPQLSSAPPVPRPPTTFPEHCSQAWAHSQNPRSYSLQLPGIHSAKSKHLLNLHRTVSEKFCIILRSGNSNSSP